MKLITIKAALISKFTAVDNEVLIKEHRPTVLILNLRYKDKNHEFAVPLRSNIEPAAPKRDYFALPNRKSTKEKHHHGLHYIKMFPVTPKYYEIYHIEGDIASKMYLAFIDKHEKRIIQECQAYLDRYATGDKSQYSTNIDKLLQVLEKM